MKGPFTRFFSPSKLVLGTIAVLLNFCGAELHAATLTYPGSAPCDTTLQVCIDGAAEGDTIQIATNNLINETLITDKSFTLTAAPGFQPQIGSGDINNSAQIYISDNNISHTAVHVSFDRLIFNGAFIRVAFDHYDGDAFTLTDSSLITNYSDGIEISARAISDILIQRNKIVSSGAGIYYDYYLLSSPGNNTIKILGNEITSADPSISGGGIETYGSGIGSAQIDILNNVLHSLAGASNASAGIYLSYANGNTNAVTTVANVINNTLDGIDYYAIYVREGLGNDQTTINLFNNVVSNSLTGIRLPNPASPQWVINNDFNHFFNSGSELFFGYPPGPNTVLSSANSDPLFVDTLAADYHLQSNSPLIDNGENNPLGGLPSTDFEGKNRIIGGTVDIGAIESGQGVSNLEIAQTAIPDTVDVGEDITYVLTVTNHGPEDALNVALTDNLPAGVTFVDAFSNQGSCTGAPQITCDLGTVKNGESVQITLIVSADAIGDVNNTAGVTSDDFDPDTSDNSSTSTATVNPGSASGSGGNPSEPSDVAGGGCSLGSSMAPSRHGMEILFLLLPVLGLWVSRRGPIVR